MSESPQEYVARDIWLASALIALGMPMLRVTYMPRRPNERPGPHWAMFVLQDHPSRPEWVNGYLHDSLAVPVSKLRTALNHCRDQMRAASVAGQGGGRGD